MTQNTLVKKLVRILSEAKRMINITEGNQIWAPSEASKPIPDNGRFG